jgi:hypothetical protein
MERSELPSPPQSSIKTYELTFGAVCGICAGVFIKKGAKAIAFLLGGVFVLLQVLPLFVTNPRKMLLTYEFMHSIWEVNRSSALIGLALQAASSKLSTPHTRILSLVL